MSIINIVKNIKQVHPEYIILIKIGKFYYSYSKDAYIISYIFNYKLKTIEENIKVCAFPVFTLNKIIVKLEENKINYIIVDRRNNYEVDGKYDNGKLNKYNSYLEKSKKYINQKNKIEHTFDKMRIPHPEKECKRKRLPISGQSQVESGVTLLLTGDGNLDDLFSHIG